MSLYRSCMNLDKMWHGTIIKGHKMDLTQKEVLPLYELWGGVTLSEHGQKGQSKQVTWWETSFDHFPVRQAHWKIATLISMPNAADYFCIPHTECLHFNCTASSKCKWLFAHCFSLKHSCLLAMEMIPLHKYAIILIWARIIGSASHAAMIATLICSEQTASSSFAFLLAD